ncbi:sensor domain-containing diguanylate cyclase [Lysobacter sp. A3-1-A15]|uniref:sensor domain-containing diguanylate cyclase n=1 Tax=Novilysobacter viscosus TaxID=3098602 RepID=UPI002EDB4BE9
MKLPTPHRLAQIYYVPRLLSFALTFVAALVLFHERAISIALLAYGAGLFLLYPQLVHVWACVASDRKAAALHGLLIDAFLVGTWVAAIGFNVGIGFALASSVCMNNTISAGWKGLGKSAAMFTAGCAVSVGLLGWRFTPQASPIASYLGLVFLFGYLMLVASVFYSQSVLLVRAKQEVDRKRLLFQGLAEAGLAMANAGGLDELVSGWLKHLQPLLPAGTGRGVVVRAPQRPGLTYHATFQGIDDAEQARLLHVGTQALAERLDSEGDIDKAASAAIDDDSGAELDYEFLPVPVEARLLDAVFILSRDHCLSDVEHSVVRLFLQQLGAALSNYSLTQKLTELANTDGLTGLANRARLDERLAQVIGQKRRQRTADFSIVMADINGLKQANDVYGHETGDRLIRAAADALRRTCRDTDLVARMGGDEFIVMCPATTTREASHFLERLAETVRGTTIKCHASDGTPVELPLSLSVGVADSRETDPAAVMRLADERMYEDKAGYYAAQPAD